MVENKLFSRKWIYNNVFKISNDDVDEQKNDIVDDAKQNYRFKQIEEEGIDPAKPFNKIKPVFIIKSTRATFMNLSFFPHYSTNQSRLTNSISPTNN